MAQMMCFLSGVSLTPQTAWVFDAGTATLERQRLKDRLALLEKLFAQYAERDAASEHDVEQARRWGRRPPTHAHRLVSQISAQAISAEFTARKLFIPWRERQEKIQNLRFRHLLADSSCNQRIKQLSPARVRAVLELAERIFKRLECAQPMPLQTRKKLQTKVCVDFVNDDGACTTDDVLQALWQHCVDKEARYG